MEIRLHVCKQNKSSHWQGGIIFFFSWEPSISADYLLALGLLGGGGGGGGGSYFLYLLGTPSSTLTMCYNTNVILLFTTNS